MRVDLMRLGVWLRVGFCVFDEGVALEFGFVSLGLHCFLRFSSSGLLVVLVHWCCWAHSAFSV